MIGALPTFSTVGILAPILLILLRMLQGLAVGGEFPGSMVLLAETAKANHRTFMGAIAFSGATVGILLGTVVSNILSSILTTANLAAWGWRIPFVLGLLLSLLGLYLRYKVLPETSNSTKAHKIPLVALLKNYKTTILKIFLIFMPAGVFTGILTLYTVTYVIHFHNFNFNQAFRLSLILTTLLFLMPVGAYFADRIGAYKKWLLLGFICVALITYPLYLLMQHGIFATYSAFILLTIIFSLAMGPFSFLVFSFPKEIRYSGFAIVHGLEFSLIGGTSHLVLNWLAYHFGAMAPGLYGILACIIGGITLLFL